MVMPHRFRCGNEPRESVNDIEQKRRSGPRGLDRYLYQVHTYRSRVILFAAITESREQVVIHPELDIRRHVTVIRWVSGQPQPAAHSPDKPDTGVSLPMTLTSR